MSHDSRSGDDAQRAHSAPAPDGHFHLASTSRGAGQWHPPTPEELQEQFSQYKVINFLGRGGMGAVYQGWQISLERYVAIKVLPPDVDEGDAHFTARFKQEAKTMARFQHPGIVSVYDAGETPSGLLYIVMEYIEGTDVSQMIKSQGKLQPEHALAITAHVCDALQYAHSHGVIHRDIKPANVLINLEGEVKVADFGLAKASDLGQTALTKEDVTMGTPDYLAPEGAIMGIQLDGRADLYALGVMLYHMLTGQLPRGVFDMPGVLSRGEIDPRFDDVIIRAMEQDREKRYQSAAELRLGLDAIINTPRLLADGASSAAIPKQAIGMVRRQAVAQRPVAHRPDAHALARQRAAQMVTYVPQKKSMVPGIVIGVLLVVVVFLGWQKFAGDSPPVPDPVPGASAASTSEMASSASSSPAATSTSSSSSTSPVGSVAQPGVVYAFGGHRYQFLKGPFSKDEDRDLATSLGGHLVTITSAEEQKWIEQTFASAILASNVSQCRTGGRRLSGRDWMWSTAEPWNFTNWDTNFPDSNTSTQILVLKAQGGSLKWQNMYYGNLRAALIEWDDLTTPIPPETPTTLLTSTTPSAPRAVSTTAPAPTLARAESRPMSPEIALLAQNSISKPEDTALAMKVATLQTWFRNDTDLAATRERMLQWAANTTNAQVAERVAKLACLSPGAPSSQQEAALALARKSVELGKGSSMAAWQELALGMAEYRSGNYSAAVDAMAASSPSSVSLSQGQRDCIASMAAFYQVMSLCKQGKSAEARALFSTTEAKMRPLPADDVDPSVVQATSHDQVIIWLACKEARALLDANPRLAQMEAQFNEAVASEMTHGSAAKAIADLDGKYLAAIDRALADATKAGKLDDVMALRAEKQRVEGRTPLPSHDPANIVASLARLRGTYRKSLAPLVKQRDAAADQVYAKYDATLAALHAELTQKNQVNDALAVKAKRDDLNKVRHPAAETAPLVAAASSATSVAPSPPPSPPKEKKEPQAIVTTLPEEMLKAPVPSKPFTPSEAVQWALSLGGSARIKRGSGEAEIPDVSRIPKGNFTLIGLKLGEKQPLQVVSLAALSGLTELRELTLDNNLVTDAGIAFLPALPKLQHLSINGCGMTDEGLSHVRRQMTLTELSARDNKITGTGLNHLTTLPLLSILRIGSESLSDEGIPSLASLAALQKLDLTCAKPLKVGSLAPLAGIKKLKTLTLGPSATDAAVGSLAGLANLETLDLNRAPISDAAMDGVAAIRGLKELILHRCPNITDYGMTKLVTLKDLVKFDIGYTRLTDAGFKTLSMKLPEMDEINAAASGMSDGGLAGLENMRKITRLTVHVRMCTDVGTSYIRRVSQLRIISIDQLETLNPTRMAALKKDLPSIDFGKR